MKQHDLLLLLLDNQQTLLSCDITLMTREPVNYGRQFLKMSKESLSTVVRLSAFHWRIVRGKNEFLRCDVLVVVVLNL